MAAARAVGREFVMLTEGPKEKEREALATGQEATAQS